MTINTLNGLVISEDRTKKYYKNGKLHNIGCPAIIYKSGSYSYYTEGLLHREDGPAVVLKDKLIIAIKGTDREWWIHGEQITEKEFHIWQEQHKLNQDLSQKNYCKSTKIKI